MILTQDLANLTEQMQSMFPEDVKSVMMQTAQDLLKSQALRVGDKTPPFVLPNGVNQLIDSQDVLNSGAVVTVPEIIRPIYHNFGIDLPSGS